MNGDTVWFFYHARTKSFWGEYVNAIYPFQVQICRGVIVYECADEDKIHVYVDNEKEVAQFPYEDSANYFFKSKDEAISALVRGVERL